MNQVPRYGREIEWKEGEIETNTLNTINKLLEHGPIYRNFTSPLLDSLGFKGVQKGILKRVPKAGIKYPNKIYRLYSYRGIYSPYAHNRVNMRLLRVILYLWRSTRTRN